MYLALYRKWRPRTFEDVVGQEPITTTLKNQVKNNKTAHSYLFTGSRGTGKTTCSKILAMAVNCLNPQDGNPCMECEICKGIEEGSILDVLEIDAASNNGVDDVRILREEANYTPAQCHYRVYIIDETHMLSVSAFNALLKIMEEPPPHVKFILATTEVHKVPATVLSRCQRFDFSRIKTGEIADRLLAIGGQEEFDLTEDAAFLIARLADGGMRDALSILDQCIAYSNQVDVDVVSGATGLVLRDYLFQITDMIIKKEPANALACVDELYSKSKDLQKLSGELIEHFRNLMIVKTVKQPGELVNCLPEELERLMQQQKEISMQAILRSITVLQECLDKISRDYDKRLTVEMAFIKLCSPNLDSSSDALLQRVEALEDLLRGKQLSPAPVAAAPVPQPTSTPVRETTAPAVAAPIPPAEPRPAPAVPRQQEPPVSVPVPDMAPDYDETSPTRGGAPEMMDVWVEVMSALKETDPALAGILAGSIAYASGDNLFIDSPNSLFASMIKRDNFIKKLLLVLEHKTGVKYKLRIKKSAAKETKLTALDEISLTAQAMGIEVNEQ